jgi:hypothetical protein
MKWHRDEVSLALMLSTEVCIFCHTACEYHEPICDTCVDTYKKCLLTIRLVKNWATSGCELREIAQ